jgi:murein DD-endopeptidase MepM/ murein hydrolase activator NlpD
MIARPPLPPGAQRRKGRFSMWYRKAIAAAIAVVVLTAPAVACAGGSWPWPVGSAVSLGYGASYTSADGRSCTHGGIDIPADPGTQVRACVAGKVTFAGPVPAGDGAQTIAVTC